ncbi:hypothetical protein [Streptomyces silvisoli]|uniref:Uncharacterized protein n=1 Tax=Streptomyces silvisoli TaxID=3034235 RepID=A0ABT5ZK02_9ACTN|nr:hypothetical protein [Streptomyces silvisoli]MDF3290163.1 hypothetical protein [Streptomyces silvisoli]
MSIRFSRSGLPGRSRGRSLVATIAAIFGCLTLAAPQAVAAVNSPLSSQVRLAPNADAKAKAFAASHSRQVAAAQTVCGSGYSFATGYALPTPQERFGTLFIYSKGSWAGPDAPVCAVFDNNLGIPRWMKLKICDNRVDVTCHSDEGNYSQYAGPVYMSPNDCGTITALMKNSASDSVYIVNRTVSSAPCD